MGNGGGKGQGWKIIRDLLQKLMKLSVQFRSLNGSWGGECMQKVMIEGRSMQVWQFATKLSRTIHKTFRKLLITCLKSKKYNFKTCPSNSTKKSEKTCSHVSTVFRIILNTCRKKLVEFNNFNQKTT